MEDIDLSKNIKINLLYDIYGKLLTKKQQEIFELYHLSDLSLREIAENKKITYQAVRDSIKTSESMLEDFEKVIKMNQIFDLVEELETIINDSIELKKEKLIKKINEINKYKRR